MTPPFAIAGLTFTLFAMYQFRRATTTDYDTGFQLLAGTLGLLAGLAFIAMAVIG